MPAHLDTGRRGEDLAARLLNEKGYEILTRNFRAGRAEIDLIARKDSVLIFVEVKTRTNLAFGMPETAVSARKAALVRQAADAYIFSTDWHHNIRYDVVAVVLAPGREPEIEHFEDAFF
ncbi:MAG: YraN family protein [Sphingobacteriaceae bacterium]|nr:YraN family protein [Cytophagaceae bacterium]